MHESKFDITQWKKGMRVKFKVITKEVIAVNFKNKEVLLSMTHGGETWFRCEDIELIPNKKQSV